KFHAISTLFCSILDYKLLRSWQSTRLMPLLPALSLSNCPHPSQNYSLIHHYTMRYHTLSACRAGRLSEIRKCITRSIILRDALLLSSSRALIKRGLLFRRPLSPAVPRLAKREKMTAVSPRAHIWHKFCDNERQSLYKEAICIQHRGVLCALAV